LRELDQRPDLAIAADLFIYIGNLAPLFAELAAVMEVDGCVAFSTEDLEAGDFELRPTLRFAHSVAYIERVAARNGFEITARRQCALRKEGRNWVSGSLYACRFRGLMPG
jgi:predicted TPR repeat methyltransferase